ncbi:hypothetical protein Hanom_Chr07g00672871 [Helianthus anomalus]
MYHAKKFIYRMADLDGGGGGVFGGGEGCLERKIGERTEIEIGRLRVVYLWFGCDGGGCKTS